MASSGLGGVRVLGYGQQGPGQTAVQVLGQTLAGFGPQAPPPRAGGQQAATTASAVVADLMLDRRASQLFLQSIEGWLQGGAQLPFQAPLPLPPEQNQQLQRRLAALAQQGSPYLAVPDLQTATPPRMLPGAARVTQTPGRDRLVKQMLDQATAARAAQGFGKGAGDLTPPKAVQAACKRGLELAPEHGGDGLTDAALGRARQMAAGQPVSLPTLKRIKNFHSRHSSYDKEANPPSPGYVAQQLWGGTAGASWASAHADDEERTEKAQPKWKKKGWVGPGGAWATAKRKAGGDNAYASAIYRKMTGKSMSAHQLLVGILSKAAGPGSRGGHIIGTTRSGKPIYAGGPSHALTPKYTNKDHDDAASAHHKLSQKMGDEHWGHAYEHRFAAGVRNHSKTKKAFGPRESGGARESALQVLAKAQGGPGSRGGHIIGTTRSGRPIYSSSHETYHPMHQAVSDAGNMHEEDAAAAYHAHRAHRGWSRKDHLDAAEAHSTHSYQLGRGEARDKANIAAMGHANASRHVDKIMIGDDGEHFAPTGKSQGHSASRPRKAAILKGCGAN